MTCDAFGASCEGSHERSIHMIQNTQAHFETIDIPAVIEQVLGQVLAQVLGQVLGPGQVLDLMNLAVASC